MKVYAHMDLNVCEIINYFVNYGDLHKRTICKIGLRTKLMFQKYESTTKKRTEHQIHNLIDVSIRIQDRTKD